MVDHMGHRPEVTEHTTERRTHDVSRTGLLVPTQRKEIPAFAEKGMQNAIGLTDDIKVTSLGDGKFDLQHRTQQHLHDTLDLNTVNKRELNQYGYNVAKQAVTEAVAVGHQITDQNDLQDLQNNIRHVRKVDGVWEYKYDHGDGEGLERKLDLNEIQDPAMRKRWEDHLEKTEQEITNLGLHVRDRYDMSEHLEKAVLKNARENGMAADVDGMIHHHENGKLYMVEEHNGNEEIREYTLDNDKIEHESGKNYLLAENVRNKKGEMITNVRTVDENGLGLNKGEYEVQYDGSADWKKFKVDKDLDELDGKNFSTETELDRVTYNLQDALDKRKYYVDTQNIDDFIIDQETATKHWITGKKWQFRAVRAESFINTAMAQASYNVDAVVASLFHMSEGSQPQTEPTTGKMTDGIIGSRYKAYQDQKKYMRQRNKLYERFSKGKPVPVSLQSLEPHFRELVKDLKPGEKVDKQKLKKYQKEVDKQLKELEDEKHFTSE